MKNYVRYAAGVIFIVLAIVLLVVGFNFIRNILNGDTEPKKQTQSQTKKADLLGAPAAGKAVQYTIRGRIVGEEEHRSIRFTVNQNERRIDELQGYNETIVKTQQTDNTEEAYKAFIEALNGVGFTRTIAAEGRGSESQDCPLGRVYSFELGPSSSDVFHTWSNSCSGKQGTFGGNQRTVQALFEEQIPDYQQFISGVRL